MLQRSSKSRIKSKKRIKIRSKMKIRNQLWLVAIVAALGCEMPSADQTATPAATATTAAPMPPPPPVAESAGITVYAGAEPAAELPIEAHSPPAEAAANASADNSLASSPTQETTPTAAEPYIQLSAGVAVPQLLPEGTQVGLSVDYRIAGPIPTSAKHELVVDSIAGATRVPVTISPEGGTLQGFLPPNVRPEHQPFTAHIEETRSSGQGRAVSRSVPLQTSY